MVSNGIISRRSPAIEVADCQTVPRSAASVEQNEADRMLSSIPLVPAP